MSVSPEITRQLVPKAPRLLPDGSGYDWREFDRWLQRVQSLLGSPQDSNTFNITTPPSASAITTGTLPHAQLPTLLVSDIPEIPESRITNLVLDLALLVPKTTKINNQALAGNITVKALDGSAGIAAVLTTAPLTPGGTPGSMTFKDGLLTAKTDAT